MREAYVVCIYFGTERRKSDVLSHAEALSLSYKLASAFDLIPASMSGCWNSDDEREIKLRMYKFSTGEE